MDELLKAIEELKRAYKASGVKSVKIEIDDETQIEIDGVRKTWAGGITNEKEYENMLYVIRCAMTSITQFVKNENRETEEKYRNLAIFAVDRILEKINGTTEQRHITNGEWLRGLSDEEFANKVCELFVIICGEVEEGETGCPLNFAMSEKERIDRCYRCRLNWLRAEHKEVE